MYQRLLAELKDAKDTGATALALMTNPFETVQDRASSRIASELVGNAIDRSATIGPEKSDSRYEAVAAVTEEARSRALGNNPFADEISGLAMEGVHKINRQTLGQLDELSRSMDQVGTSSDAPQSPSYVPPRPTPVPSTSAPVRRAQQGQEPPTRSPTDGAAENPFKNAPSEYRDESSGRVYRVPDGYALYRSNDSEELTVIPKASIPSSAVDDSVVNGKLRCSANGRGRVIAECERRRRSGNPFAAK